MANMLSTLTADEKSKLKKSYYYSLNTSMCFNHVVMEGYSFGMSVWPAIDKFYQTDEEKREAFERESTEFFNTHQVMMGLITGIAAAMEKERAEKGTIDGGAISGIKASLMGPTAGIGDSFFFNCVRVIVAGICIGIGANGNILAPLLFLLLYGGSLLVTKYYLVLFGYVKGVDFVNEAFENGIIPLIMEACSTLGAIMIGALIASTVKVNITAAPVINGASFELQSIFDGIMPGVLSLVLWWAVFKQLQKGRTPTQLIFGIMICCVLLALIGVF